MQYSKVKFLTLTLSAEGLVSMMGVFMGGTVGDAACAPMGPSPLPWKNHDAE